MAARRLGVTTTARLLGKGLYAWSVRSDVTAIDAVVSELVAICRASGLAGRLCRLNLPIAVTEAMSNAMLRGNSSDITRLVQVIAQVEGESIVIEVTDEGEGFDEASVSAGPEDHDWLEREAGRGVFLMRALMDDVQYRCEAPPARGHTVRLLLRRT